MEDPIVVTSFIILLPLIPAGCIYWLLTPKQLRGAPSDNATGNVKTSLGPMILGIKFNVLGSTAVYLVVLLITFGIYDVVGMQKLQGDAQKQQALKDDAAWLVELPVGATMRDPQDPQKLKTVPLDPTTQSQLQVALQPNYEMYGDTILFWVTPHNKRFPKVIISLPNISSTPPVDLNDPAVIDYDYANHEMVGIGKQWIQIQKPYDASVAVKPTTIQ